MSHEDDLIEAFGLLWRIRLERHADLMARGEPPHDLVDPATLPRITERARRGTADNGGRMAGPRCRIRASQSTWIRRPVCQALALSRGTSTQWAG